ncbi:MAG: 1-deoxy-D-xylulose-5-phosphate synthase [Bacilli bacterium]|nr:1-deoxy-D-xylulose-5-phosphate synthase [Bacilli bacterium]
MAKKKLRQFDIQEIQNPEFLKDLSYPELDLLSEDIRKYIIEITSKNGGHLSSNLGTVEAIISLCKNFDFTKDKIVFDVGHQTYTYKILTGRKLDTLRKKDGISGFQKMDESIYDHFEAGHSSTSISVASAMAYARDLKGEKYNVIAFIGESSLQNGLALEGLNTLSESGHKVIIVLNDNDMSISKGVGGLSSLFRNFSTSLIYRKTKGAFRKILRGRFGRWLLVKFTRIKNWIKRKVVNMTIFDNLGYAVIGPIDGHYIRQLDHAFERAKRQSKSVVIHIKTIKGKGYKPAEDDTEGDWHGVSKFNIETGEIAKKQGEISWSEQYNTILKEEMAINDKIVTVVPATGHGSALDSLFKAYPTRVIDVGISEEHAFTFAGGLAASGLHPVVSIYSTFMQRSYDELLHDLARMNLNATILIDRAGLVGSDGETHQGIYDEAFLYTIPNVTITMASRSSESLSLFKESLSNHGVFAIRYPREYFHDIFKVDEIIPYGSWKVELSGHGTAIISTGPMTLKLKEALIKENKDVTLFNAIYLRPMDIEKVNQLLNYQRIIIYNPYSTKEGFANALESKLYSIGYKGEVIVRCVPTQFVKQATIDEQRKEFGLAIEDIISLI